MRVTVQQHTATTLRTGVSTPRARAAATIAPDHVTSAWRHGTRAHRQLRGASSTTQRLAAGRHHTNSGGLEERAIAMDIGEDDEPSPGPAHPPAAPAPAAPAAPAVVADVAGPSASAATEEVCLPIAAAASAPRREVKYDMCGTYGCILADKHPGLHRAVYKRLN